MARSNGQRSQRKKQAPRGPTNVWDSHQRTVLHVLHTTFRSLGPNSRAQVFAAYFKTHLAAVGLSKGLKASALDCQYYESRLEAKKHIWAPILAEPSTDAARRARRELIDSVRKVIEGLHNTPVENGPDEIVVASTAAAAAAAPTPRKVVQKRTVSGPSAWSRRVVQASGEPGLAQIHANASPDLDAQPERGDELETIRPTKRRRSSASYYDATSVCRVLTAVSLPSPSKRAVVTHSCARPPTATTPLRRPAMPFPSTPQQQRPLPSPLMRKRPPVHRSAYSRPKGPVIQASAQDIANINSPYHPIPAALAQVPLVGGLYYRFWDEHSYGVNTTTGFEAARFRWSNARPPPPSSEELRFEDVDAHVSNHPVASPFISVSNNLLWVLRKAMKETEERKGDSKVTIIDADVLEQNKHVTPVFHLPPYFSQLKKHKTLIDGKWRYGGMHEYLVWREIPAEAVLATFKLKDLFNAAFQHAIVGRILRLKTVGRPGDLKTAIVGSLKDDKVEVTLEVVAGIAKLCRLIGLSGSSTARQVEHLVMDITQGWQLHVTNKSQGEWAQCADVFVHKLSGTSSWPGAKKAHELKVAFLHAVRSSAGQFNAIHWGRGCQRTIDRAADAAGLSDPAGIVLSSMMAVMRGVRDYVHDHNDPAGVVLNSMMAAVKGVKDYEQDHSSRRERDLQAGVHMVDAKAAFKLLSDVVINQLPSPGTTDTSGEEQEQEVIRYENDDDEFGL